MPNSERFLQPPLTLTAAVRIAAWHRGRESKAIPLLRVRRLSTNAH